MFKKKETEIDVNGSIVNTIKSKLSELESEIVERNAYMNERDKILYDKDYLVNELDIKAGFDATDYNFLSRAVEIHKSQVMGRGFNVLTQYDKEDITLLDKEDPEYELLVKEAQLTNKRRAMEAANAKHGIDDTIEDNGGFSIFTDMAGVASGYGVGIIKKWWDAEEKRERVVNIESPQLFRAGWRSNDFRLRDFDVVVYDVSQDYANKMWKDKLPKGVDSFPASKASSFKDGLKDQTSRPMVTVVDFTGILPGINNNEPMHVVVAGDYVVGKDTNPDYLPKYYIFQNKTRYRRPWGASDISDRAISMNKSYIELMSDCKTLLNKMFPFLEAVGFDEVNLPQKTSGEIQVFPVSLEQSLNIKQFQPGTYPYNQMLNEIKEGLFRELGLGRVLIDDPSVSFESNQALMTGMKSTIDIAEDKQNRWKPVLCELFTDILEDLKKFNKDFAKLVGNDNIRIDIEWPSVLRKEDASYRTMLFNDVRAGLKSIESYMSETGVKDPAEEVDRITSEMKDEITGAILSANLRMVNQIDLQKEQQDMMMKQQAMQQPTNAPLTTDQNQGTQPASQPGSGAPAVSPEGMAATMMQNNGEV